MQNRLVFFLIVIAVILAIAGFLLVSFLTRDAAEPADTPPEQPPVDGEVVPEGVAPDSVAVQVDNTTVYLNPVAERTVSLQPEEQVEQPTPLPLEPTLEPTPEIVVPTEPPATAAPAPTAAAPAAAPGGQAVTFIDYVVQPGDTLYRITEKQATSIELMAVHGISSEDVVPGATLRLPVANPGYCPAGSQTYVVRPGDNVFRIAAKFNTTTQAIAGANNLGADFRIDIAQVLCIP